VAQHAFWIIVDGTTPTSFRSRQREDLVPTLTQLQRTQPQVALMWFERGRLWPSPTEAREALGVQRTTRPGRKRDWRPGGDHVDPRAKYVKTRDEKRARFKSRLGRDRSEAPPAPSSGEPQESKPARPPFRRPDRPEWRKPSGDPPSADRPFSDRPPRPRPPAGSAGFGKASYGKDRPAGGSFPRRDSRGPSSRGGDSRGPGSRGSDSRGPGSRGPDSRGPGSTGGGDWRNRDRDKPPPRQDGPPRETSEKPRPPKGFGDRPWRPKKPWRPTKPKGGSGSGSR
jgi:hypothetical protein